MKIKKSRLNVPRISKKSQNLPQVYKGVAKQKSLRSPDLNLKFFFLAVKYPTMYTSATIKSAEIEACVSGKQSNISHIYSVNVKEHFCQW